MAFKRALWSSGYEYRATCPYCRTKFSYRDNQLDFRPWYPNGFVYCPKCRKPFRHNEIYAVDADGNPVYKTQGDAKAAINVGYYGATGMTPEQAQNYAQRAPDPNVVYCSKCGKAASKGDAFCSGCGNKLKQEEES